jgi:hypothetical protein
MSEAWCRIHPAVDADGKAPYAVLAAREVTEREFWNIILSADDPAEVIRRSLADAYEDGRKDQRSQTSCTLADAAAELEDAGDSRGAMWIRAMTEALSYAWSVHREPDRRTWARSWSECPGNCGALLCCVAVTTSPEFLAWPVCLAPAAVTCRKN